MPVLKCSNGKWRIGTGDCIYETKESADSAYRGYLFKKSHESQSFEGKRFDENKLKEKLSREKQK